MALLLASALVAATLDVRARERLFASYPIEELRADRSAAVGVLLVVSPEGKVRSCDRFATVGNEELAAKVCGLVERLRLEPAKGPDGTPMFGVMRTFLSFSLPGDEEGDAVGRSRLKPELELTVSKLPEAFKSGLDAVVTTVIDGEGVVVACEHATDIPAAYGQVACQQAGTLTFDKVTDDANVPTSYVRRLTVRFAPEPSRGAQPSDR